MITFFLYTYFVYKIYYKIPHNAFLAFFFINEYVYLTTGENENSFDLVVEFNIHAYYNIEICENYSLEWKKIFFIPT